MYLGDWFLFFGGGGGGFCGGLLLGQLHCTRWTCVAISEEHHKLCMIESIEYQVESKAKTVETAATCISSHHSNKQETITWKFSSWHMISGDMRQI